MSEEYEKINELLKKLNEVPADQWKEYCRRRPSPCTKGFYTNLGEKYILVEEWAADDSDFTTFFNAQIAVFEDSDFKKEIYSERTHNRNPDENKKDLYNSLINLTERLEKEVNWVKEKKVKEEKELEKKLKNEERLSVLDSLL